MYEVVDDVRTLYQYDNNQTVAVQANQIYAEEESPAMLGSPNGVSFAVFRAPDSVFANVNSSFHTDLPADRGHLLMQCATIPLLPNTTGNVISGFVAVVQPEAAGEMHLASNDFRDDPIINSNYWGSESKCIKLNNVFHCVKSSTTLEFISFADQLPCRK
jgi:choline dehydrogenase